ncbi:hypothetical protein ACFQE5_20070 [Pseudonocardia hispaniensis]|uniref:NnrS family protein n=1 Tax=Pseudonocardia hispaniensis TaxID=904933 RepID=A0ABW1J6K5_9PSEU
MIDDRPSPRPGTALPWRRAGFLLPAGLALLAGLDAAVLLLGLPAPVTTDRLPAVHGMLLVLGFVGTLVALERAVAGAHPAGFTAALALGIGGVLLLSPAPIIAGRVALCVGSLALIGTYVPLWRRQRDDAVLVQAFGAVLAAGAALLWLADVEVAVLLPWLVGFVVLTIGGERLELARLAMGPRAAAGFLAVSVVLVGGIVATLLWPPVGYPLLGCALLAVVAWLGAHDVARRTITSTGLPRFIAGCLLAGYGWLGVAGAIWLVGGAAPDGARYDAVVHAVFLGFTISMIMAHAPVILPAVLRRPLPYHPVMLVPAVLLHLSLVVRLWAGDAFGIRPAWQAGGLLNVTALLLFVAVAIWSALRTAGREGGG